MERDETTRGCLARIQAHCTSAVQALVSGIENCSGHKDIRAAFLACMLGIILVLPRLRLNTRSRLLERGRVAIHYTAAT